MRAKKAPELSLILQTSRLDQCLYDGDSRLVQFLDSFHSSIRFTTMSDRIAQCVGRIERFCMSFVVRAKLAERARPIWIKALEQFANSLTIVVLTVGNATGRS